MEPSASTSASSLEPRVADGGHGSAFITDSDQFSRALLAAMLAYKQGDFSVRMWLPQENKEGYDAVNLATLAPKLDGRLMIYYGTADDNVHPNNAMQFIAALQRAKKSFEVQVGPDLGHTSLNRDRMMEFFIENLVLKK